MNWRDCFLTTCDGIQDKKMLTRVRPRDPDEVAAEAWAIESVRKKHEALSNQNVGTNHANAVLAIQPRGRRSASTSPTRRKSVSFDE